jgi:tetratricopeptide (TPR) repeat protein
MRMALRPPSTLLTERARFALWRAVTALLRVAADSRGLLIVLEDLHAADHSSLELLRFVANELRATKVLIMATWRDRGAVVEPEIAELLRGVERQATVIGLGRLTREASLSLINLRAGVRSDEFSARVLHSSQGNPLFLHEMLRLLDQEGEDAVMGGALPRGVAEAIEQRLAELSQETRALVELLAVIGDETGPQLLSTISAGDFVDFSRMLAEATHSGVLAMRTGRCRFVHALLREALYRDLSSSRRRELHARAARVIERLHHGRDSTPWAELSHHALRAPRELLSLGAAAAIQAATSALMVLSYDDAINSLSIALTAIEQAGNPSNERLQVLLAMAEARIRRGDVAHGKADCREAAAIARELGDTSALVRAALAYGQVLAFATVDPVLVGLLREALEALPSGDSVERARLLARLGGALQPAASSEEPVRIVHEAFAIARRLTDSRALLETLHDGMSALMDVAPPRERLQQNLEIEQLALQLDDRERLLRTYGRLVVDHLGLDELDAADARIDAYESLARELRASWYGWRVPLFRALRAQMHGRFEQAERLAEEALEQGRAAADPLVERLFVLHREGFLRTTERHGDMVLFDPRARRERAVIQYAPAWQAAASALVHARLEQQEQARTYFGVMPEAAYPAVDNLYGLFFVAEPAAAVGREDLVQRLHDALVRHRGLCVVLGMSYFSWEGPVTRLLGLLSARLGRFDQACTYLEEALAHAERLSAWPSLARTHYELARTLLGRATAADAERARNHLLAAHGHCERLPLPGLRALVNSRLEGLGQLGDVGLAAVASRDESHAGEVVSIALEGEYWTLVYRGQASRYKDGLGMQYLARLLREPRREFHVLAMAAGDQEASNATGASDAGELIDASARAAYRRRMAVLRESLDEAEVLGDSARVERTREEIEALSSELSRSIGLGGRLRRVGGAGERARSAVRRRIRHALDRIRECDPMLGAYLERTVRTGNYCVYRPEPGD